MAEPPEAPPGIHQIIAPDGASVQEWTTATVVGFGFDTDHPNGSLGHVVSVSMGGAVIPEGTPGGTEGWLKCPENDDSIEIIIPPNTLTAQAENFIVICNTGGCTTWPIPFASYNWANTGDAIAWGAADINGDPPGNRRLTFGYPFLGDNGASGHSDFSGVTYRGGAATLIAFIDIFTVGGAAADFPWVGGGWEKLWESGVMGPDGFGSTGHSQVWIYRAAPQSVLQGIIEWGPATNLAGGRQAVRICILSPCVELELVAENPGGGPTGGFTTIPLNIHAEITPLYLAWLTDGASLFTRVDDEFNNFSQVAAPVSDGAGCIANGHVDYSIFSGVGENLGTVSLTDFHGHSGFGGTGAVWKATGPRNNIYPARGFTIWETCCGCFFDKLPQCGEEPIDYVGWLVGVTLADHNDVRLIVWPKD